MMQEDDTKLTFLNVAGDWKSSPHMSIISIKQLRNLLASLSIGEPGIVNLESKTGLLQLGLGGPFACAQFTTRDEKPHYLSAKAKAIRATAHVEFLCGNTPTPIAPELCVSFADALKIAEYFFTTGSRSPDFEWVEI
jgi:Immunity protein Imm1